MEQVKVVKDLEDLLYHEVQALYSVETLMNNALERMVSHASDDELRTILLHHLEETELHKERLENVARYLEIDPGGVTNPSIKGLISEGEKLLHKDASPETMDASLISCAQKIEHYEISSYGTAASLAEELGFEFVSELLEQTLEEEKEMNSTLNILALSGLNQQSRAAVA